MRILKRNFCWLLALILAISLVTSFWHYCVSHRQLLSAPISPLENINLARKQRIDQGCDAIFRNASRSLDWSNWNNNRTKEPDRYDAWFKRLIVSEPLQLVFCPIPKGANTNVNNYLFNIESILANLSAGVEADFLDYDRGSAQEYLFEHLHNHYFVDGEQSYNFLSNYPIERAKRIMAAYKKMVIVRNPAHRFISAWQDKFAVKQKQPDIAKITLEIFQSYRKTDENTNEETLVKFEEFSHYIYDSQDSETMNWHWRPQWEYCNVCQIDYDFVGNNENLDAEFQYFLGEITGNRYQFPPMPRPKKVSNRTEKMNILKNMASHEYFVKALKKHYRYDFSLFGYEEPKY